MLAYHIHYFVRSIHGVLEHGKLEGHDSLSFAAPEIGSDEDWQSMLQTMWNEAEQFAGLVAAMPEERWGEVFTNEKYGTYYHNMSGVIEHAYYHLGQIALFKKLGLASQ
jgi:uncharacterized damage-inducible protein DinB